MKGLGYLVRALAQLKDRYPKSIKLLVLGRDRSLPYRRLAERAGVGEDVVFAGSTTEIEKYYGASDLLVHPTFYDACSLTVLEALASGLPVVTTSRNGASGVLEQMRDGWILEDPADVKSLSRAIEHFLNRTTHETACERARRKGEAFSEAFHFSRMRELFDQVIGGHEEERRRDG
jgi:UDP-glucose:(heptosyl)LPS alpha-1,3-glucosyltransferase